MKKNTRWSKHIAVILCVCFICGLCSCGNRSEQEKTEAVTESQEVKKDESTSEIAEDDMSETLVYTLTTPTQASYGDWNEFWLITHIEELFNVDIQVETISSDVWAEKSALLFASDSLPDFFAGGDLDIANYGSQGYFLPLEDYISEETTPNIWKMWQEYPEIKKYSTELDGHIYAVWGLNMSIREKSMSRFFVNSAWVQEILGKEEPETLDEFYQYLKGVKERDMNGDGDPNNEIPFGGYYNAASNANPFYPILAAFGYTSLDVEAVEGGEVIYVPAEDTYKEFLKYMNMLYEEGLLDSEFFTQTEEQFKAKDAQGLYGAFAYSSSFGNHPEDYTNYDGIEPMTSAFNPEQVWPASDIKPYGKFLITKDCENPERLVKIMDWFISDDGWKATFRGFEMGTHPDYPEYGYIDTWLEDGSRHIVFQGPGGESDTHPAEFESGTAFRDAVIRPGSGLFPAYKNFETSLAEGGTEWWLTHNIVDHVAEYYHVGWPQGIKYTVDENQELTLLKTDITAYKEEMESKMINGELDIDENWDEYIAGLESRGLKDLLSIHQTAYDRWAAID